MITVNTQDVKEMEADLKTFAHRAYPFATKSTINGAAFHAQREARSNVRNEMTTRNAFTVQSIQVDQARTLDVARQAATVGSTADYMETQEFGGTKTKTGKEGVAITTSFAAGQEGQEPRSKLATKSNKLQNIALRKRQRKGKTRKQRNLIAVKQAARSSQKHVFMDLGRRQGIFRVMGGKRSPRVRMVHDMSRQSVNIPRSPWLSPAVKRTEAVIPSLYEDALRFQIRRNNIFR